MKMLDKLVNFVAQLGTDRDKAAHSNYTLPVLAPAQLDAAYRGAWLPRKIVDIPAHDSVRAWRNWHADKKQIELLEAEEKRIGLQAKLMRAQILARLHGGSGIFIGTDDRDLSLPLDPSRVRKGGLRYLLVLPKSKLSAGQIEADPMLPTFGTPKYWNIGGAALLVHPSRLAIFNGAPVPDPEITDVGATGFGDSVLTAIYEALQQCDNTMANVASMVFEAKTDVLGVPDFMENVGFKDYRDKLLERTQLAALSKGINGMVIRDAGETFDTKQLSFSGVPDIIDRFLQAACGAADIPATRLLGQTAKGLGNDGEGDLRNYYDRIASMQALELSPTIATIDECVIRSATGARDPHIYYKWASLWQTTPEQRADTGKTRAETVKIIADTRLIPEDALALAVQSMLVENDVLPGLEAALDTPGAAVTVGDAAPRSLYVSRKVENALEILEWARGQGLTGLFDPLDMHVTVCYSRQPVDWMQAGTTWGQDEEGEMKVAPGGARMLAKFDNALVLLFNSSELSYRHMQLREMGASWDHGDYQPHITLRYDAENIDPAAFKPYTDEIELGPEIFEEVNETWSEGKP